MFASATLQDFEIRSTACVICDRHLPRTISSSRSSFGSSRRFAALDDQQLARCVQFLEERERSVIVMTFYDDRTAADDDLLVARLAVDLAEASRIDLSWRDPHGIGVRRMAGSRRRVSSSPDDD